MNISRAARLSGLRARTIRYYESIDLMPRATRQSNGYRDYSDSDVAMLSFINHARDLGFSIKNVKSLVTLWQDRNRASSDVKALAQEQITSMDQRIQELEAMRTVLLDLSHRCHGDERPQCPILEGLESGHATRTPLDPQCGIG